MLVCFACQVGTLCHKKEKQQKKIVPLDITTGACAPKDALGVCVLTCRRQVLLDDLETGGPSQAQDGSGQEELVSHQ